MTSDGGQDSPLTLATRRLERAAARLEQRLAARLSEVQSEAGGAFDEDRARLAADLDAAHARERELEEAGAQASAALTRAIADIRSAFSQGAG